MPPYDDGEIFSGTKEAVLPMKISASILIKVDPGMLYADISLWMVNNSTSRVAFIIANV